MPPPPAMPAPEPLVAQRAPDLGAAIPAFVFGYVEARAGAKGGAIVFENLYQSLGGDPVPAARDLLDQAEVAGLAGTDPEAGEIVLVVRVRDPEAFEAWVSQTGLDQVRERHEGVDRFALASSRRLAWIPSQRLFLLGSVNLVEGGIEALRGEGASLVDGGGITVPADTGLLFVANLTRITKGMLPEPLVGRLHPETETIEADMSTGPLLPGLSLRPLPHPNIAERLPAQTVAYFALAGVTAQSQVQLGIPVVDDLLGRVEQATLVLLSVPDFHMAEDATNVASGMAGGIILQWKQGRAPNAEQRAALSAELPPELQVAWRKQEAVLVLGAAPLREATLSALNGKNTLGARAQLVAPGAQARLWLDMNALLKPMRHLLSPDVTATWSGDDPESEIALTMTPASDTWRYHFDGTNVLGGVAIAGAATAIIIYSVRRYLVQTKVDETTAQVRSIAEAAAQVYARRGTLCPSAAPVPSIVPPGKIYLPSTRAGEDFGRSAWRCLGVRFDNPLHYQLAYRRGGPGVKSAVDGALLPAGAFEAIARGDLDGNGETSLIVVRGDVEAGVVRLRPEPHLHAPFE